MAKSDFQIQSESGQLWKDLLEWRAEAVASVALERDAAIAKCSAIEAKAKDPDATKEDIAAEADKAAQARELEELQKLMEAKQQEEADIQAKIDALSGGK